MMTHMTKATPNFAGDGGATEAACGSGGGKKEAVAEVFISTLARAEVRSGSGPDFLRPSSP